MGPTHVGAHLLIIGISRNRTLIEEAFLIFLLTSMLYQYTSYTSIKQQLSVFLAVLQIQLLLKINTIELFQRPQYNSRATVISLLGAGYLNMQSRWCVIADLMIHPQWIELKSPPCFFPTSGYKFFQGSVNLVVKITSNSPL